MVTLAQALVNPSQVWTVWVEVEGVGVAGVQSRFCYVKPDFAAPSSQWVETLTDEVDLLSERTDIFGGFPELGSVNFNLLDHGDFLTDLLRLDGAPATTLSAALDATTTTVPVRSTYGLAVDDTLFSG